MIILLALGVGLGTALSYRIDSQSYRSSGMIDLSPVKATVPTAITSDHRASDNAHVVSQMRYLRSREVLARAAADPRMIRLGWPEGTRGLEQMRKAVNVIRQAGGDVVTVEVVDDSPHTAQMAVDCVLDAYVQFDLDQQRDAARKAVIELDRRCAQLHAQLTTLGKQIEQAAQQHGGIDAYLSLRAAKQAELKQQAQRLAELEAALATSPAKAPRPDGVDDTLARLEEELATLAADYEQRLERFGPNHPLLQRLRQRMNTHMQVIDELTDSYRLGQGTTLTYKHAAARDAIDTINQELAKLAQTDANIQPLIEQRDRLTQMRDELLKQREAIELESTMEQSLASMIVSSGHLPHQASTHTAMQGASLGLLAALLLLLGIATTDRRTRWPDQLAQALPQAPLMAVLPQLADADAAAQQRMARNMHRMRDRLARQVADIDRPVVAVTGIEAGDGATSIAINLAGSICATGQRVLLIDADLEQRGITEQLNLHGQPGLVNALDSAALPTVIHPTPNAGLSVMPVGVGTAIQSERLAALPFDRLLGSIEGRFDLIIIDSGALATSASTLAITDCADHTITVVHRGRSITAVQRAMHELLTEADASASIVFNGAALADAQYLPRYENASLAVPVWPWAMMPAGPQAPATPPSQQQRPAA